MPLSVWSSEVKPIKRKKIRSEEAEEEVRAAGEARWLITAPAVSDWIWFNYQHVKTLQ